MYDVKVLDKIFPLGKRMVQTYFPPKMDDIEISGIENHVSVETKLTTTRNQFEVITIWHKGRDPTP